MCVCAYDVHWSWTRSSVRDGDAIDGRTTYTRTTPPSTYAKFLSLNSTYTAYVSVWVCLYVSEKLKKFFVRLYSTPFFRPSVAVLGELGSERAKRRDGGSEGGREEQSICEWVSEASSSIDRSSRRSEVKVKSKDSSPIYPSKVVSKIIDTSAAGNRISSLTHLYARTEWEKCTSFYYTSPKTKTGVYNYWVSR